MTFPNGVSCGNRELGMGKWEWTLASSGSARWEWAWARGWWSAGTRVAGFDASPDKAAAAKEAGISWAGSIAELVSRLPAPRIVWTMVPAGDPTDLAIAEAARSLQQGDIVIDGGNSFYRDSIARGSLLAEQGIRFLDAGVSGGVWGREARLLPDGRRR